MIEMKPILNLYAIQCTDYTGTHLFTDGFRLQLFRTRELAEKKACEVANDYYLIQVIPHSILSSEIPYVTIND
jgi:hypothetical protein